MSVRRRRLSGTGAVCAAVWAVFTGFASPAAEAITHSPLDAGTVISQSDGERSLLSLDRVLRRPLAVLRLPGQAGAIVAHRGYSSAAPENTMPALSSTTAVGAEYFEIDIRLSKDGVPVVIHDSTVDRTTDGTGAVADMTIEQLRALDAGSWFDDTFADTRIPTLDEVLDYVADSGADVVIEYKGTWSAAGIRTTIDMIDAADLENKVLTQSFSQKTVANISKVAPTLPVGWLTDTINASIITTAQQIGADAVNPSRATARSVAQAHRAGLGVFVWTHDEDADWEALTAMGVDGIITNRPDALQKWMHDRGRAPAPGTVTASASSVAIR
ncbi:glycerophosphodiester phosphodiesterase [Microbacterium sp. A93]|uniref:glycerophosphodiester phosphodiesterase n=1 Tax=Microbacterium sp. A93 TaxID=3450716 RepID=UPI003F43438A